MDERDMIERVVISILIPALLLLSWPQGNGQKAPPARSEAQTFFAVLLAATTQENDLMIFTRNGPNQVAAGEVFTVTEELRAKVPLDFAAVVSSLPEGFELQSGDLRKFEVGLSIGDALTNSYQVKAPSQEGTFTLSASARGKPTAGESQALTVDLTITVAGTTPPPPPPPPTNERPVANFSFSPVSPKVGEVITFNASTSSDPDGTIANYRWSFGDGAMLEGPDKVSATHSYQNPGTFQVTLYVQDDQGALSAPQVVIVTVEAPPPPTFLGLPLEAVIAIGAVVAGVLVYFLVRTLQGYSITSSTDDREDEATSSTVGSTITAVIQKAGGLLLAEKALPLKGPTSVKVLAKVDELNRSQWVRTLVNRGLIVLSRDEGVLLVKPYGELSMEELAQLDLSPLGVDSLRDFVMARVAVGDSIVSLVWATPDGNTLESLAVADSYGQIKYDTLMSLTPLSLTPKN
jgi:PKD repeat protein